MRPQCAESDRRGAKSASYADSANSLGSFHRRLVDQLVRSPAQIALRRPSLEVVLGSGGLAQGTRVKIVGDHSTSGIGPCGGSRPNSPRATSIPSMPAWRAAWRVLPPARCQ